MPASVVIGLQWGDEGKGKAVDLLVGPGAFVVRYQGGDNAGHTIVLGEDTFKLHLVPSALPEKSPSGTSSLLPMWERWLEGPCVAW